MSVQACWRGKSWTFVVLLGLSWLNRCSDADNLCHGVVAKEGWNANSASLFSVDSYRWLFIVETVDQDARKWQFHRVFFSLQGELNIVEDNLSDGRFTDLIMTNVSSAYHAQNLGRQLLVETPIVCRTDSANPSEFFFICSCSFNLIISFEDIMPVVVIPCRCLQLIRYTSLLMVSSASTDVKI